METASHDGPDRPGRTAVVLAAGGGSRLRAVAGPWPKTMVEVGRETLLARSLRCLRGAGVERLVAVGGYRRGVLRTALADLWPGAELVESDEWETTGSMRSLALAVEHLGGAAALVLESDLLYETRALDEVLAAGEDTVLCSGPTGAGDEVWVCGTGDGGVREVSKAPTGAWPVRGELVGISLLSGATLRRMVDTHRAGGSGAATEHYEERIAAVAADGGGDVRWLRVDGLLWAEVDTPEHLARAEREVLPAVEARDGAHR